MAFTQDELARAAYSAYGESTGHKNYQGNPMPDFDDLGDAIQNAWRAAATTAGRMGEVGNYTKGGVLTLEQITEALNSNDGAPVVCDVTIVVALPGDVVLYERNTSSNPAPEGRVLEMAQRMLNVIFAARGEGPVALFATRDIPEPSDSETADPAE
jgi:hypothetical protein